MTQNRVFIYDYILLNVCLVLYQPLDHTPRAINHVENDLPILSGLKYMPRLTRSSCNAITEFANVSVLYGN